MEKKTIKKKKKSKRKFPIIFRVHYPRYTKPKLPTDLLVYLHSGLHGEKKTDKYRAELANEFGVKDTETAVAASLSVLLVTHFA